MTSSINTTLEGAAMYSADARGIADRLLAGARGFASHADSSVAGAGAKAFDGPRAHTLCFLLAQSSEVTLKSFLVLKGVPLADLAALMGLPPGHADIGYQIDFGALYPGMTLSAAIAAHP